MVAPGAAEAEGPTTLLVSPSLQGHRAVYCRVLSRELADAGHRVVVAADLRGGAAGGLLVRRLTRDPRVRMVDVGPQLRGRTLPLDDIRALAERAAASVVLLAEADDLLPGLVEDPWTSGAPGSPRVVGLFVRATNARYRVPPSRGARTKALLAGRRAASPDTARAFAGGALVDTSLVLDEGYAAEHAGTHSWLPDIFRDFDGPAPEADAEAALWDARLQRFLAAAGERPVLAYIGANQHRRGYDTLLRLAQRTDGVVLHCGAFALDGEPSDEEVVRVRRELADRGALFETGGQYAFAQTADVFIRAARCVVLPYRGHDGSSGVMLQALAAGRPVLVPDRGLMACRVRGFGLGATFAEGDEDDLERRFLALLNGEDGGSPAAGRLAGFIAYFSRAQVAAAVAAAIGARCPGARLPVPDDSSSPDAREGDG